MAASSRTGSGATGWVRLGGGESAAAVSPVVGSPSLLALSSGTSMLEQRPCPQIGYRAVSLDWVRSRAARPASTKSNRPAFAPARTARWIWWGSR